MVKTLQLAISKAAALPAPAQEQLGRELLERIAALSKLREAIEAGVQEPDAGKGEPLMRGTTLLRAFPKDQE